MDFYNIFLSLCNGIGKSPSRVALDIGTSKPAVTRWKSGSVPSDAVILKLANYFDVSVEYLKGESDTKEKTPAVTGEGHSKEAIQFLERFKDLPPEAWAELAAFAEFQAAKHKHTER